MFSTATLAIFFFVHVYQVIYFRINIHKRGHLAKFGLIADRYNIDMDYCTFSCPSTASRTTFAY